jgi:hypothetical protein
MQDPYQMNGRYDDTVADDAQVALELQIADLLQQSGMAAGSTSQHPFDLASLQYMRDLLVAQRQLRQDEIARADQEYASQLARADGFRIAENQRVAELVQRQEREASDVIMVDHQFAKMLDQMERSDSYEECDSMIECPQHLRQSKESLKGKGKVNVDAHFHQPQFEHGLGNLPVMAPKVECGICFEQVSFSFKARQASSSRASAQSLEGFRLTPCRHPFCVDCLTQFIRTAVNERTATFPLACPQPACKSIISPDHDDVFELVSEQDICTRFMQLHVEATKDNMYCPNKKCSELLLMDDADKQHPDFPACICPRCNLCVCFDCKVRWHKGFSCAQYQALPPEDRHDADLELLQLAKSSCWKRCPSCSIIIERELGCNFMNCKCGTAFCYKCGTAYKNTTATAANQHGEPGCTCGLFDVPDEPEPHHLIPNQPQQHIPIHHIPIHEPHYLLHPFPMPPLHHIPAPEPHQQIPPRPHRNIPGGEIGLVSLWEDFLDKRCRLAPWLQQVLANNECCYCNRTFPSLKALDQHLSNTNQHIVFHCCRRIFKTEMDLERHEQSVHA